jgi:hypothetical protein
MPSILPELVSYNSLLMILTPCHWQYITQKLTHFYQYWNQSTFLTLIQINEICLYVGKSDTHWDCRWKCLTLTPSVDHISVHIFSNTEITIRNHLRSHTTYKFIKHWLPSCCICQVHGLPLVHTWGWTRGVKSPQRDTDVILDFTVPVVPLSLRVFFLFFQLRTHVLLWRLIWCRR